MDGDDICLFVNFFKCGGCCLVFCGFFRCEEWIVGKDSGFKCFETESNTFADVAKTDDTDSFS